MSEQTDKNLLNAEVDCELDGAEMNAVDKSEYPLFSVLVLCYKNEQLLKGMLKTIFNQDYPRIQLIVSDDGSRDFDVERVTRFIEENKSENIESVTVRKNEENMGTVRHVALALQKVAGEYVIFTAADDRFNNSAVFSDYAAIFENKPESKWIVGRCCVTTPNYSQTIYVTPTDADEDYFMDGDAQRLFSRWSRRGMAIPCCMAFRKEAFELVGGIDLEYRFLEDWPLVLKLLRNGYAPAYLPVTVASHSAGGVTNSNQRYGVAVRKAFYDDKYLVMRKEVEPYLEMIDPEDRQQREVYLREIMERNYFLDIDFHPLGKADKIKAMLKKPKHFFWVFEELFMRYIGKLPRKKMVLAAQLLIVCCCLLLQYEGCEFLNGLFAVVGIIDLVIALLAFAMALLTYPVELYYKRKAKIRNKLVN